MTDRVLELWNVLYAHYFDVGEVTTGAACVAGSTCHSVTLINTEVIVLLPMVFHWF